MQPRQEEFVFGALFAVLQVLQLQLQDFLHVSRQQPDVFVHVYISPFFKYGSDGNKFGFFALGG